MKKLIRATAFLALSSIIVAMTACSNNKTKADNSENLSFSNGSNSFNNVNSSNGLTSSVGEISSIQSSTSSNSINSSLNGSSNGVSASESVSNSQSVSTKPSTTENSSSNAGEIENVGGGETVDNKCYYVSIKVDGLSVRSGAGANYKVIGTFNKGDLLGFYGTKNGWYITYIKGEKAYVSANAKYSEIIAFEKQNERIENVINVGIKLLGTKYVYGATRYHNGNGKLLKGFTATKFDCSSLVQYVFYIGNKDLLGLTTRNQIKQGTLVARSKIKRGDLLFFTNSSRFNNVGVERVGHVAIYLGNNYILHTASDYAVIEQISFARWNYYIEARRIIA